MSKSLIIALATAATALANAALHLAEGGEATTVADTGSPVDETGEPKAKRGRPAKTEKAEEPEKPQGKSLEELKKLIQPLVDASKGADVKAALKDLGAEKLSELDAKHHDAFEKAIKKMTDALDLE